MTASLSLQHVTKRYGAQEAVRDVTFELGAGQCVALVGHNGAGKTTLIKLLLGLTRPTSGSVRTLGEDPLTAAGAAARMSVGYLPENVVFPPALTGLEMLRFYGDLKRRPRRECDELLDLVGLGHAANKRIGAYSKGMRQRLGLAQALLGSPRLLFLDEPTTGLDPLLRQNFYAVVRQMRDRGVTILLSSHALSELETNIDWAVIMHRGEVLASGPLEPMRSSTDLPVRMILAFDGDGGAGQLGGLLSLASSTTMVDGHLELTCSAGAKMEILRRAVHLPQVRDIEVAVPTLDQLYADLLERKERAA